MLFYFVVCFTLFLFSVVFYSSFCCVLSFLFFGVFPFCCFVLFISFCYLFIYFLLFLLCYVLRYFFIFYILYMYIYIYLFFFFFCSFLFVFRFVLFNLSGSSLWFFPSFLFCSLVLLVFLFTRIISVNDLLLECVRLTSPGSSEVTMNLLRRWDVSSIPANGIFLIKKTKN